MLFFTLITPISRTKTICKKPAAPHGYALTGIDHGLSRIAKGWGTRIRGSYGPDCGDKVRLDSFPSQDEIIHRSGKSSW